MSSYILTVTIPHLNFRGTLEGKRQKPDYEKLLAEPMLKYSGLYQEECADLVVVCQIYDQNQPIALPVSTSYKAFTSRWKYVFFIDLVSFYHLLLLTLAGMNGLLYPFSSMNCQELHSWRWRFMTALVQMKSPLWVVQQYPFLVNTEYSNRCVKHHM